MDILTEKDKVVMCKVMSAGEFGFSCQILENWGYDIEGELFFTEITRKKLRIKPNKLLSLGKTIPLRISGMDKELVILSKIQIDKEEREQCQERFQKYKTLDNIIHGISYKLDMELEELYEMIGRPLIDNVRYPLDIYEESIDRNFDGLIDDEKVRDKLAEELRVKLRKKVKMVCELVLKCHNRQGINAIKDSLKEGQHNHLTIYMDSPPVYVITHETKDVDDGRKLIETASKQILFKLELLGGMGNVGDIKIFE